LSGGRKKTYLALKRRCRRLQWLGEARPSFSSCSPCFSFSRSVSLVSFVCLVFSLSPSLVPSLLYFFFSVFFVPCSLLVSLSSFFSPSVGSVIFCLKDPGESFVSILKGNPEGPLFFFFFSFRLFFPPFFVLSSTFYRVACCLSPRDHDKAGDIVFQSYWGTNSPTHAGLLVAPTRSKLGCVFW
jgi:hypothetical protein